LLTPHGKEVVGFEFDTAISEEDLRYFNDPAFGYHWYCNGNIFYRDIFQPDLGDYWVIKFCFYFDQFTETVRAEGSGNEIEEYRGGQQVRGKPPVAILNILEMPKSRHYQKGSLVATLKMFARNYLYALTSAEAVFT
jgi:hypothetical protein